MSKSSSKICGHGQHYLRQRTRYYLRFTTTITWGHAVAQLAVALCYKPEGRGFDFNFNFHGLNPTGRTLTLRSTHPASNRNEYQEYPLGGKRWPVRGVDNLATFMCLNLLQPSGPVQTCIGIALPLLRSLPQDSASFKLLLSCRFGTSKVQ